MRGRVALLLCCYLVSSVGRNLYVGPGGQDDSECTTETAPCSTLKGAVSKAAANDQVVLLDGTYSPVPHLT